MCWMLSIQLGTMVTRAVRVQDAVTRTGKFFVGKRPG